MSEKQPKLKTFLHAYSARPLRLGATYLGETPQAVNAIALTLGGLVWQLPLALSQAVAIRIGNLLGANLPRTAERASEAAQVFTLIITATSAVLLQVLRRHFAQLFSTDPLVLALFSRMVRATSSITHTDISLLPSSGMAAGNRCILRWNSGCMYRCIEGGRSARYRFSHQSF
jgi:Na+-driven multidrug efflux pump